MRLGIAREIYLIDQILKVMEVEIELTLNIYIYTAGRNHKCGGNTSITLTRFFLWRDLRVVVSAELNTNFSLHYCYELGRIKFELFF